MREGARAQAAIEILGDVEERRRPASDALKDWMLSHRFAGSKDRAAIGDLVFGAMRWKASSAWRLGADDPRAWVFGALRWGFGRSVAQIEQSCYDPHAPSPPTQAERAALDHENGLDDAPEPVRGDYPAWLDDSMARVFGAQRGAEGAAMAAPAPLDLRANRIKCDRDALIADLGESPKLQERPHKTPYAPDGVRVPWSQGRTFPWSSEQAFQKGWFEVQDEGSQIAAMLAGAAPGLQVGDVCAGGGGKTLALAAAMQNKGQIYAFDVDARRLAPLHQRAERAGVRNLQIRAPRRGGAELEDLHGKLDIVFVDAPCSGSGTWRRAPDTKWRLRENAFKTRQTDQQQALDLASPLVKSGGRLVYVTCSILPEENEDSVVRFLRRAPDFEAVPLTVPIPHHQAGAGVQFTPLKTGCDGFFVCVLRKV